MTRRPAGLVVAALAVAGLTGCTGGKGHVSAPQDSSTQPGGRASIAAARWWSNEAGTAGSSIDTAHPSAAAAKLGPSRSDYCAMLQQTLAAGHSLFADASAQDPAVLAGAEAFVGEITKVAPTEVADAWRTLGPVIVALVKSGTAATASPAAQAATAAATQRIAADAKSQCKVDLAAVAKSK